MSLQDPGNVDWYMDIGAIAHLHAESGTLTSLRDNCNNSNFSVLVEDGSCIPVTKISHSTLRLNLFCTLILRNVHITP